jgi:hypothetical protein
MDQTANPPGAGWRRIPSCSGESASLRGLPKARPMTRSPRRGMTRRAREIVSEVLERRIVNGAAAHALIQLDRLEAGGTKLARGARQNIHRPIRLVSR